MKIENWKFELAEYGALHETTCCVNDEEGGCDAGMKDDECCENIRLAANFAKQFGRALIDFISYDMNFKDENQRKKAVEMYCESLELNL